MAHRHGIADEFTKEHKVFQLVWYQENSSLISALKGKVRLKTMPMQRKIELVENSNPNWQELAALLDEQVVA